jgi:hypothetical protein
MCHKTKNVKNVLIVPCHAHLEKMFVPLPSFMCVRFCLYIFRNFNFFAVGFVQHAAVMAQCAMVSQRERERYRECVCACVCASFESGFAFPKKIV